MLLHRLELENIRLFKGNHSIDLTPLEGPSEHRPIVIIGGKNGAGKTTLFESILLCLYGPRFDGSRMSVAKYERFIRQMVTSQSGAGNAAHAFIELEFSYSHLGRSNIYTVKRYWQVGTKFTETFTIKRDGYRLNDIESEQWQEFLNELIPLRLAQLFLFDGEKIQTLVEQDSTNLYLKDSFKSLLGLDLVERLKADLSIYISQQMRTLSTDDVQLEFKELQEQLVRIEKELIVINQDAAGLNNRVIQVEGEIERIESLIAQEGGNYARKREKLKSEKSRLDGEISALENAIREMAANLLPFAVTPRYCRQLQERLQNEREILAVQQSQAVIKTRLAEVASDLKSSSLWAEANVPPECRDEVAKRVLSFIETQLLNQGSGSNQLLIHQLSEKDHQRLSQWLDQALNDVPQQLVSLTTHLENQTKERRRVAEMINRAPDDEAIAPMIRQLNKLHEQLGQAKEQHRSKEGEKKSIEFQRTEIERKLVRVKENIKLGDKRSLKVSLAGQAQKALEEYIVELQNVKLTQLKETLLTCFTRLLRKENYIVDLRIAPGDYTITLIDRYGNSVPQDRLSAGEKEIFAIAMLWALTLTSGRQLPFIIDTPLGRLDSDHRGNLVMDFFQTAGDQMIIFSTDTEIDREFFKTLSPHIARAYHLDYSHGDKQTEITSGYFWSLEEAST